MPTVTNIAPDPRQPDHRLIEVDRGRFASLPVETVVDLGLTVVQDVDARTLARLSKLADAAAAHRAGLRALARRPFAVRELRRKLLQRQHPAAAVDAAIDRLSAAGLVDDARYAQEWVAAKLTRGRGPARLLRDLQAQGVERRLAEDTVRDAMKEEGVDPIEAARAAAQQRAPALRALPPDVGRRRLAAFLLRRGFGGPHLADVVREALSGS